MAKPEPAQSLEGHQFADRHRDEREHLPEAAVKKHWLITIDQKVIEGEASACRPLGYEHRHSINPVRDFVRSKVHRLPPILLPRHGKDCCKDAERLSESTKASANLGPSATSARGPLGRV